jgi:hypothetical protein
MTAPEDNDRILSALKVRDLSDETLCQWFDEHVDPDGGMAEGTFEPRTELEGYLQHYGNMDSACLDPAWQTGFLMAVLAVNRRNMSVWAEEEEEKRAPGLRSLLARASGSAQEILRLFDEGRFPEHEMFEDGVIELCRWVLEIDSKARMLLEET